MSKEKGQWIREIEEVFDGDIRKSRLSTRYKNELGDKLLVHFGKVRHISGRTLMCVPVALSLLITLNVWIWKEHVTNRSLQVSSEQSSINKHYKLMPPLFGFIQNENIRVNLPF